MWGLESLGIPYNAADGTMTVPVWAAAGAAALILVLFILALVRTGLAGTLVFLALIGFGGWFGWTWLEHERSAERRAIEARMEALDAQKLAPGSMLACLDGTGGEALEAGCERSVFGSPEAAATAVAYTAARIAVLRDGATFAATQDPAFEAALARLRGGLEQDRFGVVAHILASGQDCTADKCDGLRLFRDANRIRTHLREKAFDGHLTRAAATWSSRQAAHTRVPPATEAASNAASAHGTPLPPGYNLPSSASIPPVSIMAAEPTAPPPAAAAPAHNSAVPAPPKRPAHRSARPRRQTNTVNPPVQLTPPTRVQ